MKLQHTALAGCLALLGMSATLNTASATVGFKFGDPVPAAAAERLPVFVLSSDLGDAGRAMMDDKTVRYTLATAPDALNKAVVYIDIDSFDKTSVQAQKTLQLAQDLGWSVILESNSWDVNALRAFAKSYSLTTDVNKIVNVAVKVDWVASLAVISNTTPTEVAMSVGIPFSETAEGDGFEEQDSLPGQADYYKGPSGPIHWSINFANAAYMENPTISGHYRALNLDVVKVFKQGTGNYKDCVVAFRGSSSYGDWIRNIESQFGPLARVPGESSGSQVRAGIGYVARLNNISGEIWDALNNGLACGTVYVTGHSLGGAMAELYAFKLASLDYKKTVIRYGGLFAYNPARVGNSQFRSSYYARKGSTQNTKIFCRYLDPVWYVPTGLQHLGNNDGCTTWGPSKSRFNLVKNHSRSLWL